jgi:hypothetical protein
MYKKTQKYPQISIVFVWNNVLVSHHICNGQPEDHLTHLAFLYYRDIGSNNSAIECSVMEE